VLAVLAVIVLLPLSLLVRKLMGGEMRSWIERVGDTGLWAPLYMVLVAVFVFALIAFALSGKRRP
jgi:hypothetical protein